MSKLLCRGREKPSKLKTQKQSEDNTAKNIRNLFKRKEEIKARKDRIIRDIETIVE